MSTGTVLDGKYLTTCYLEMSLRTVPVDIKTISIATDSCGEYLSNGVCYEFSGDNRILYSLFGVDLALR